MKELTIQAEELYRWRERLKQTKPSEEADIVIRQVENLLKGIGVNDLEKRFFVITNSSGNVAGDYGWIVFYHPIFGEISNGMIAVCEEFSSGDSDTTMSVPFSDLTEITEEQYDKIGDCLSNGEDPTDVIDDILFANKLDGRLKEIINVPDDEKEELIKPDEEIKEKVIGLKEEYQLSNIHFIEILSTLITDLSKNQ